MFDMTRPCLNCPFRKGVGERFQLRHERLDEIVAGPAFQCHKTIDYSHDEGPESSDKPQQCAGLMSVLNRDNTPNQIMQVASRLGHLDLAALDPRNEAYGSMEEVRAAHNPLDPRHQGSSVKARTRRSDCHDERLEERASDPAGADELDQGNAG